MDGSIGAGLMAVFAVSGSVAFLSLQLHKRLLSDFMKKIEFELGSEKDEPKKKVRFAKKVVEMPYDNKDCGKKHVPKPAADQKLKDTMPLNWQALYKGIIQYRKQSTNCI